MGRHPSMQRIPILREGERERERERAYMHETYLGLFGAPGIRSDIPWSENNLFSALSNWGQGMSRGFCLASPSSPGS